MTFESYSTEKKKNIIRVWKDLRVNVSYNGGCIIIAPSNGKINLA